MTVPPVTIACSTSNENNNTSSAGPSPPAAMSNQVANNTNKGNNGSCPQRDANSAKRELIRFHKIFRRLQWKLRFLEVGYKVAIEREKIDPALVDENEIMFKLDYFEFFMLMERAIIHLLLVFGIVVERGSLLAPDSHKGNNGNNGIAQNKDKPKGLAASAWRTVQQHTYHANVIATLMKKDNPLHTALGTGEVLRQLQRAKELRNRWKTAGNEEDDKVPSINGGSDPNQNMTNAPETEWRPTKKVPAPLESYRVPDIVNTILCGFDAAEGIARRYVYEQEYKAEFGHAPSSEDGDIEMHGLDDKKILDWATEVEEEEAQKQRQAYRLKEIERREKLREMKLRELQWQYQEEDEEDPWGFMVEAMDWEAV